MKRKFVLNHVQKTRHYSQHIRWHIIHVGISGNIKNKTLENE